ncbi:unnamed protein product, partial [Timema podura]|nr:unnamed protein product [Timema podura]
MHTLFTLNSSSLTLMYYTVALFYKLRHIGTMQDRGDKIVEDTGHQMERTSRGKFEGGDAAWEEERLQSYSTSEVRLIEIQENLCTDIKDGINQCHFLAEENEQLLEEWWFSKQMEEPDLFKFLCINTLKHCCPDNHYGTECKACPGFPDNVCNKSGKCKQLRCIVLTASIKAKVNEEEDKREGLCSVVDASINYK